MEFTFLNPEYLWFLAIAPFLVFFHFYTLRYTTKRAFKFANFEALKRVSGGYNLSKNLSLFLLRLVVFSFLILAIAGTTFWYNGLSSDFSYVLAIDASGSMLADDIAPNRLQAAKESAKLFVDILPADSKVGVISFSGIGFIEQTVTDSKTDVKLAIDNIEIQAMHGTALGEAMKSGSNLLFGEEKGKVIIILTDGRENVAQRVQIDKVLDYIVEEHITVHTIGVGTQTGGNLPGINAISTLDDTSLIKISNSTGGSFYRATDKQELISSYQTIATSTEGSIPVKLNLYLLLVALTLLFFEWTLVSIKYRTIP